MIQKMFLFCVTVLAYERIERGTCWANIDGNKYDLSEIAKAKGLMSWEEQGYTYYMRLCDSLKSGDLPAESTIDIRDVSVARCQGGTCQPLLTTNSFDFKLYDKANPSSGFIYEADGEPILSGSEWTTFDIDINLRCDSTATNPDVNFETRVSVTGSETTLILSGSSKYGCPTSMPLPAPTPEWTPDCSVHKKVFQIVYYGVFVDFHDLNGGPYGIRAGVGSNVLFYQPCERMLCPPGYSCDTEEYSSVWLCNPTDNTCTSYGLIDSPGNLDAKVDIDFEDYDRTNTTLTYRNPSNNRRAFVMIGCDKNYKMDHFEFPSTVELQSDDLYISALAADACPTFSPTPLPAPDSMCTIRRSDDEVLNLTAYNHGSAGWSRSVKVNGQKTESMLYMQPCDGMGCPNGHECEGDDHATVWLCTGTDCKGYGLMDKNLTAQKTKDGIEVIYKGDRKRSAHVYFEYDDDAHHGEVILPSEVTLTGSVLSFEVGVPLFDDDDDDDDDISGGAVFLVIVIVGVLVYVAGTMLYQFIRKGVIEPPHKEFWGEVWRSICICVKYVSTCGGRCGNNLREYDSMKYDAV